MSAEELELDDLLGAYALDAVSDEERRAVEQYLMINPRARQEVGEHREVATMLAWSGMSAPDGLWDRIAAQIDTVDAPSPTGQLASVLARGNANAGTAAPVPPVASLDDARRSRAAKRGWFTAGSWVAASAAAAVVAIVAVTVIGGDDTDQPPLAAAVSDAKADRDSLVATLVNGDGAVGAEVVIDQDGHGYVIGGALPTLPADQTYQLWGVIGEQVISLGVLGANPEIEPFSAGGEPVSQVVVTIEAAGGVVSNGNPEGAYAGTLG
jgi:anti-sigma-K factor RskA